MQSNDSRVNATLESFVDTQPSRCQPTADLDLIVAHVEGDDQLFTQGPHHRREREGFTPHRGSHDDSGRAGAKRGVRAFDRADASRDLQVNAIGDLDASAYD